MNIPILPDSLKSVLHEKGHGGITAVDDRGFVRVLVNLPRLEVAALQGPQPVSSNLGIRQMPTAPVVLWSFYISDDPRPEDCQDDPNKNFIFFNVLDQEHVRFLNRLSLQKYIPLHFVDGNDFLIVATVGLYPPREYDGVEPSKNADMVLQEALGYAGEIPADQYDFKAAVAAFQEDYLQTEVRLMPTRIPSPCEEYYERFGPGNRFIDKDFLAHVMACAPCSTVFSVISKTVSDDPLASS